MVTRSTIALLSALSVIGILGAIAYGVSTLADRTDGNKCLTTQDIRDFV